MLWLTVCSMAVLASMARVLRARMLDPMGYSDQPLKETERWTRKVVLIAWSTCRHRRDRWRSPPLQTLGIVFHRGLPKPRFDCSVGFGSRGGMVGERLGVRVVGAKFRRDFLATPLKYSVVVTSATLPFQFAPALMPNRLWLELPSGILISCACPSPIPDLPGPECSMLECQWPPRRLWPQPGA